MAAQDTALYCVYFAHSACSPCGVYYVAPFLLRTLTMFITLHTRFTSAVWHTQYSMHNAQIHSVQYVCGTVLCHFFLEFSFYSGFGTLVEYGMATQ